MNESGYKILNLIMNLKYISRTDVYRLLDISKSSIDKSILKLISRELINVDRGFRKEGHTDRYSTKEFVDFRNIANYIKLNSWYDISTVETHYTQISSDIGSPYIYGQYDLVYILNDKRDRRSMAEDLVKLSEIYENVQTITLLYESGISVDELEKYKKLVYDKFKNLKEFKCVNE